MKIYRVEHPDPSFRGVVMGVDFFDGHGSTSSPEDVVKLVKEGCRLRDPEARAEIRVLARQLGRLRQAKRTEYERQEAFERTPEYTESALRRKAEREEAEKQAKRHRRRKQ